MTLELDDVVLFETPELLVIEYPTLDVGDDIFDVRGTHELIDETVHFLGDELGTLVGVESTESGDRVCLIEKPTDDRDVGFGILDDEIVREARWIRHEDPLDPYELDLEPRKSAEQIVDEIDELLDDLNPAPRLDGTSGEWHDRLVTEASLPLFVSGSGDPRDDVFDTLQYAAISSADLSIRDEIERDDRFVGPVDGADFRQRYSGSIEVDVDDETAEEIRELFDL